VLPGIASVQGVDGLFQVGLPEVYITDVLILIALRVSPGAAPCVSPGSFISLTSDYFALLLIGGIVISGVAMRHLFKIDGASVKQLAMGLVSFCPVIPEKLGVPFYIHVFLVSVLLAYFPFSKLMHAPGVFLSPTRNLANDSRGEATHKSMELSGQSTHVRRVRGRIPGRNERSRITVRKSEGTVSSDWCLVLVKDAMLHRLSPPVLFSDLCYSHSLTTIHYTLATVFIMAVDKLKLNRCWTSVTSPRL